MNYIEFVKQIKNEQRGVYVVSGDDVFLLSQVEQKLKSACKIQMDTLDMSVFDGENFSCQSFENAFVQLPFSALKRLVVVKNIPKLSEADKKLIKEIISKPNNNVALLFSNPQGEDFSFILHATKVDCCRLNDNLCKKFIEDKLRDRNIEITQEAANKLISLASNNLGKIVTELDKLVLFCMGKSTIEEQDVLTCVKGDLEYKIYELSDLLLDRNLDKALLIISDLLTKKEEPTAILSLLASNFRRLYYVKITPEENSELAKALNIKEYAVKIAKEKQAKVGAMALKNINECLLEVDYLIKSGEMPADLALFYAVIKINSLVKNRKDYA